MTNLFFSTQIIFSHLRLWIEVLMSGCFTLLQPYIYFFAYTKMLHFKDCMRCLKNSWEPPRELSLRDKLQSWRHTLFRVGCSGSPYRIPATMALSLPPFALHPSFPRPFSHLSPPLMSTLGSQKQ